MRMVSGKVLLAAAAFLGAALLLWLFGVLPGRTSSPTQRFETVVVSVDNDAPPEVWARAVADLWQAKIQSSSDGSIALADAHRGRIVLLATQQKVDAAVLEAISSQARLPRSSAVAVIFGADTTSAGIQRILNLDESFAHYNDVRLIVVTNSTSVAALLSLAPARRVLYPGVIFIIVLAGALGGAYYSMGKGVSFEVKLPGSGRRVETGVLGHCVVGGGAAIVLVALAAKGFGLALEPLFRWPYEGEGLLALLQVVSVALLGGYLGISLIEQVSEQWKSQVGRELGKQRDELADNWALAAKSLYSTNYGRNGEGISPRIQGEILQLAKRSNDLRHNSLAFAMIAEVFALQRKLPDAIKMYSEAIRLLPDPNLLKPERLHLNLACAKSQVAEPAQINSLIEDLKAYVEKSEDRTQARKDIEEDTELEWARGRPEFRKAFPPLTPEPGKTTSNS